MVPDSPAEASSTDMLVDPFSPGLDASSLAAAAANVLTPIVVAQDSKDLIDLSYQSPKPEVGLKSNY